MKDGNHLRHRFRLLILMGIIITLLTTALLMGFEMWRIAQSVSREYARLYTQEFVADLQGYLSREIGLVLKAAQSSALKNWMRSPNNDVFKTTALEEITQINHLLHDGNFFVALQSDQSIYFTDQATRLDTLVPQGILSSQETRDVWYFNTIASESNYLLNIDVDRFLQSMRVWVNVQVKDEQTGRLLGVAGTGIFLDPLLEKVFLKHAKFGAKTLVVNEFGAIQLDSDFNNIAQNSFGPSLSKERTLFQFVDDPEFKKQISNYFDAPYEMLILPVSSRDYQYAAIAPLMHTNWHAITFFSIGALYKPQNFIPLLMIAFGALALMTFAFNIIVHKEFVVPFERLRDSIQLKNLLQEESLYGLQRQDEFGVLARSIQQMTERLMHSVSVGMFILGADGTVIYTNPYFLDQFKCASKSEFIDLITEKGSAIFKRSEDAIWAKSLFTQNDNLIPQGNGPLVAEVVLYDAMGDSFWADIRINKIDLGHGNFHYEGILINIQAVKENMVTLKEQADHDPLTGLYNRNHFEKNLLHTPLSSSDTQQLSLVLFDLDHFKVVNDTWGHDIGDSVLVKTADIAKSCLRHTDTLIRWGGEEFLVWMRDTDSSGAIVAAEKIRRALETTAQDPAGIVTASFGLAQRLPHEPFSEWYKRADTALYRAKHSGRNMAIVSESIKGISFFRIQWGPHLKSGNPELDRQHQSLVSLAEKFLILTAEGTPTQELLAPFTALMTETIHHFEYEIEVLKGTTYPPDAIDHHQLVHQELADQIRSWHKQLSAGTIKGLDVFALFIQQLIVEHLIHEDKAFFKYLDS